MSAERPTADDIRALRDSESSPGGMGECKAVLLKEWRRARLQEIRNRAGELYTVEACNDVILELIVFLQEVDRDND